MISENSMHGMHETTIQPAPEAGAALMLPEAEVHVWYAWVDLLAGTLPRWTALLSPEELARAERFCFERDCRRFAVTRGVLRTLLGAYCSIPPAEIAFDYLQSGKPCLPVFPGSANLQFNLSHSDALSIYAFVRSRRVGIDVEFMREVENADRIVAQHFAREEVTAYQALAPEARQRGFFNGWTRKEAFVKALGEGLGFPLDTFVVSLVPSEPGRIVTIRSDPATAARWTLWDLSLNPSFVAALTVEGTDLQLRSRVFAEEAFH